MRHHRAIAIVAILIAIAAFPACANAKDCFFDHKVFNVYQVLADDDMNWSVSDMQVFLIAVHDEYGYTFQFCDNCGEATRTKSMKKIDGRKLCKACSDVNIRDIWPHTRIIYGKRHKYNKLHSAAVAVYGKHYKTKLKKAIKSEFPGLLD